MDREQLILRFREMADFLERYPSIPPPQGGDFHSSVYGFVDTKKAILEAAKAGPKWEKGVEESFFMLTYEFPSGLRYELNIRREKICERVVVRVDEVEERVPVTYEIQKVKKEIVQWHCPESIFDKPQEAEA